MPRPRVPQHGGMSLHADVSVPAHDRRRLERLCRYVARPPLAHDRLEERSDGRLALRLKTRWRDGTTHILMQRHELIERLVPLIPPPRAHQVRYHGVLAPCASARKGLVPGPRAPAGTPKPARSEANGPALAAADSMQPEPSMARPRIDDFAPAAQGPGMSTHHSGDCANAAAALTTGTGRRPVRHPSEPAADCPGPRRLAWAELLQRVFERSALCCPRCGARMRLVAAIEDPEVVRKILACLDLPARAPPHGPASGGEVEFGHAPEPRCESPSDDDPAWAFDQTPPYDDTTA